MARIRAKGKDQHSVYAYATLVHAEQMLGPNPTPPPPFP